MTSGPGADAVDLVVERWRSLDRPLELSSLAWALQNEFGAEVSDDWFGFRTFKRFLTYAVPDGEITGGPQAYLLPADGSVEVSETPDDTAESSSEAADGVIPDEAQELRRIDRGFPLIETDQWHRIYEQLAEAWRRHGGGPSSTRMLNQITRSARDRAGAMGEPLSRRHLDHVAKTVFAAADAETPLTADEIGDVFVTSGAATNGRTPDRQRGQCGATDGDRALAARLSVIAARPMVGESGSMVSGGPDRRRL